MNLPDEPGLRSRFQHLRQMEHEQAPAWRLLEAPVPARPKNAARLWLPAAFAAGACLLLSLLILRSESAADLSDLPEFFRTDGGPLFSTVSSSPAGSDFLLPTHLTIQLP